MAQEATDQVISLTLGHLRERGSAFKVLALGTDCFAMSLVACDSKGAAISPVFTYADNRSVDHSA